MNNLNACSAHSYLYQRSRFKHTNFDIYVFYYHYWVDTSVGGLFVIGVSSPTPGSQCFDVKMVY